MEEKVESDGNWLSKRLVHKKWMTHYRALLRMVILGLMDVLEATADLAPEAMRHVRIIAGKKTMHLMYDKTLNTFVLKSSPTAVVIIAEVDHKTLFTTLDADQIKEIKFGGTVVYSRSWTRWLGAKDGNLDAPIACR